MNKVLVVEVRDHTELGGPMGMPYKMNLIETKLFLAEKDAIEWAIQKSSEYHKDVFGISYEEIRKKNFKDACYILRDVGPIGFRFVWKGIEISQEG